MIDCKQLPIPKYKLGDKVWIVDYMSVKEVEIDCVEIKVTWFNDGYTARQESRIIYEIYGRHYQEGEFYNSKRTAQRVLSKEKIKIRQNSITELRKTFDDLKSRCSLYGLTINDL